MKLKSKLKSFCCCCCSCLCKPKGGKRDTNVYMKEEAGKDEDPSVVMGNSNATIHPSTKTVDSNVSEVYSQREISGAVVIERTKKTKTKTTQNSTIINDTKNIQPIDSVKLKELEQEIDNLNNQLKERKNRINELESSLQINNNNIEEEKNEFSKIQSSFKNELLLKDQSIQLQEDKLKVAKGLVDKSNRGLEALALVISHYVTQIEHTTSILNLSQSKSSKLENTITKITEEKCSLQSTVNELKDKLENESCRCEVLQKEYETLRLDHQAELSKINEEHVIELNKAVTQKQKEYDTKFQEILDKQNEDAEAHANEIKRLKEEHEKEKQELHNEKEKEARLSAEPPRLTSPGGTPIYTDKYNNMPEELKSLNIVLDLKNEELKNLRSKAMELERKLESHHDLQTKYDVLLQKHQSMSEMLKQRAHNERQLSVERESLMEKFENESKKVSRLSMEKEQLIWRASNPDLSYRSLTRFEEDEECDDDEERDSPPSPLRSSSGSFSANSTPRRPKGSADSEIAKKLKRRSMNF